MTAGRSSWRWARGSGTLLKAGGRGVLRPRAISPPLGELLSRIGRGDPLAFRHCMLCRNSRQFGAPTLEHPGGQSAGLISAFAVVAAARALDASARSLPSYGAARVPTGHLNAPGIGPSDRRAAPVRLFRWASAPRSTAATIHKVVVIRTSSGRQGRLSRCGCCGLRIRRRHVRAARADFHPRALLAETMATTAGQNGGRARRQRR